MGDWRSDGCSSELRPPVNSLWFWGGGVLPDAVGPAHAAFHSGDEIALALADAAGIARPLPPGFGLESGDEVFDLHEARDLAAPEHDWQLPATASLRPGKMPPLPIPLPDGSRRDLAPR